MFYQDFNEQFEGYTQLVVVKPYQEVSCFIRISMNNLKDIHNYRQKYVNTGLLFYQDFNEQFEGYTQLYYALVCAGLGCFIRISMNNLKDIHNMVSSSETVPRLFYQDFNEQFEGYTQLIARQQ